MGKEDCKPWLLPSDGKKHESERAQKVKELKVGSAKKLATLTKLFKRMGIEDERITVSDHQGKGKTAIDISPNASRDYKLPVIHIEIGKKGRLRYKVFSPKPRNTHELPGEDNPNVLQSSRDLVVPSLEGTRLGLNIKTHLDSQESNFVYCLDEVTGVFRMALPKNRHDKDSVKIGGHSVIGLEFKPDINKEGEAISSGKILFLGPPPAPAI